MTWMHASTPVLVKMEQEIPLSCYRLRGFSSLHFLGRSQWVVVGLSGEIVKINHTMVDYLMR